MKDSDKTKAQLIHELNKFREMHENCEHRLKNTIQDKKILQDFIDNNPMSIQIVDKEGYTIMANPAHHMLFLAKPKDDFSIFRDSQLIQQGLDPYFARLKKGEVVRFPVHRYNAADFDPAYPDNPVYLQVSGFPVSGTDGRPIQYIIMHVDITDRIKLEKELEEKNVQLRDLHTDFHKRIEMQRKKLAAEVHDHLIQDLYAHKVMLETIKLQYSNPPMNKELKKAMVHVKTIIKTARNILMTLWPAIIDQQGLEYAIKAYLTHFAEKNHFAVNSDVEAGIEMSSDMKYQLFMIFQEALTNVAKHAGATMVTVSLKRQTDKVYLIIADDGKGMGSGKKTPEKHFGLLMMNDLANTLGGNLTITSRRNAGTVITVVIPDKKI